MEKPKKNIFLQKNPELGDYNQYWYSPLTIDFLVKHIMKNGTLVAFLSTPSVYYSISDPKYKENCYLFEVLNPIVSAKKIL